MAVIFSLSTTIIVLLSCLPYSLRKMIKRYGIDDHTFLYRVYRFLQRYHKLIGITSILLMFIHCGISEKLSNQHSDLGTFLIMLWALLAITYILRNILKRKWLQLHRASALALCVGMLLHIVIEISA